MDKPKISYEEIRAYGRLCALAEQHRAEMAVHAPPPSTKALTPAHEALRLRLAAQPSVSGAQLLVCMDAMLDTMLQALRKRP